MSKKKNKEPDSPEEVLLKRLIELTERNILINLYLAGASRNQMKSAVGVGTDKADKIISVLKELRKEK
jgi:hypothetical protein